MTRVPTLAQHQLTLFHTLNTKARVGDLQLQLASGQKSQTYAGIPQDSLRLVTLESRRGQLAQFRSNIAAADQRLNLMDISLESIEGLARDLRKLLSDVLVAPDAAGQDLVAYATNLRTQLVDLLNARDGERYLFGGTRTDRPPVDLSSPGYTGTALIEGDGTTVDSSFYEAYYEEVQGNSLPFAQGSFYAQIFFDKNGVLPSGPLPADPDNPTLSEFTAEDPDLWQYYVDRLNSAEMIASPKLDYYQGDDGTFTVRADVDFEVGLDLRADDPVFQQIFSAIDAIANLPNGDASDPNERAIIAKARDMLNGALDSLVAPGVGSLDGLRTQVASTRQLLGRTDERHERFDSYAEGVIHDIEGIDEAEVIVRLQSDQRALEASYAVLSRLTALSLLDYL